MIDSTKRRAKRTGERVGTELPNHIRLLANGPLGFYAGDTNLYRYVGNNPTNEVDPSGLAAQPGEITHTPTAVSGLLASEKEIGGEAREKGAVTIIEKRFGINIGDVKDQKYLMKVKKATGGIQADFVDFVNFSAKLNGTEGSIIQYVETTITGNSKNCEKESIKSHFVEGWVVDDKGNQRGLDNHSFGYLLDTDTTKSLTVEINFTVGVGLYDNKKITGERGGNGSIKGVFDIFPDATSDKINWLGPKKTYKVIYFIDADGNWKFVDQSTGFNREGTFDKEKKKE